MKAYTYIEQSRRLAGILLPESADMFYFNEEPHLGYKKDDQDWWNKTEHEYLPCWSLAALIDVIPNPSLHQVTDGWRCDACDKDGNLLAMTYGESPIDACYEMILKINELKLL